MEKSNSVVPVASRSLILRADLVVVPLMVLGFGLQFWDKAVLGSATLFGIIKDLDLAGKRYSTASSIFYLGYLAGAIPAAFLSQRWRLNWFLGGAIVVWGAIVMLTPAVTNWQGLYAQRFFLGFVESSVSPGFVAVTRMWYTREEQTVRLGIWYSATGLFSIVSGLTNFGLGKTETALKPWMILFLVPGAFTIFLGVLFTLLLPATPESKPLLAIPHYNLFSEEERRTLHDRVKFANLHDEGKAELSWREAKNAALDPKLWLFFFIATAIYVCNGAVTVGGALIVKSSFGATISNARALALQAPGGAVTVIAIYLVMILSRRIPNSRLALMALSSLPAIAGGIMCLKGDWKDHAVPYVGYLLITSFGAPFLMLLSVSTANIREPSRQAFATGIIFVGYCLGNYASGYIIILPRETPTHYPTAFRAVIGVMSATVVLAGILAAVLFWENKQFDKEEQRALQGAGKQHERKDGSAESVEGDAEKAGDNESRTSSEEWQLRRLRFRNVY